MSTPEAEKEPKPEEQTEADAMDGMKMMKNTEVDVDGTGKKKSIWKATLETMGMAEGKSKAGDVMTEALPEAIEKMTAMLKEKQESNDPMWKLENVPYSEFNAKQEDLLKAFVLWSQKDDKPGYNVSKAFRRFEGYADWMNQNGAAMKTISKDKLKASQEIWKMALTYDKENRMVWTIEMAVMDIKKAKEADPQDTFNYFVWTSHLMLFDPKSQENGMMFLQSIGKISLWETFSLFPPELSAKLDRLTIGVMPVKMKKIYMLDTPTWIKIFMTLLKPFLSKKMRSRMVTIGKKDDPQKVLEEDLGKEGIPTFFAGLEGGATKELLSEALGCPRTKPAES